MILNVILPLLLALIVTYCLFNILLRNKINFKLIAQPNANTVTHVQPIPLIGGLGIFLGVALTAVFFLEKGFPLGTYLLGLLPMAVLGVYKDRFQAPLSSIIQLVFQITTCLILYFYWNEINHLSYNLINAGVFVVICCIIINSYNFIDVMDGLAGAYIASVLILLGASMIYHENIHLISFVALFTGAILAFLRFNWRPAKLFMGDLGSFGLIYTVLFIIISIRPVEGVSTHLGYFFVFFLVIIEFTFTVTRRIMTGRLPWIGDGVHISTLLLKKGIKSQTIVIYAVLVTIITNLLAVFCFHVK